MSLQQLHPLVIDHVCLQMQATELHILNFQANIYGVSWVGKPKSPRGQHSYSGLQQRVQALWHTLV